MNVVMIILPLPGRDQRLWCSVITNTIDTGISECLGDRERRNGIIYRVRICLHMIYAN